MRNFKLFAILGLTILTIGFLSCSAEDGEDGAIGPQGEQGVQGEPGADGNANVIASEWLDVTFSPVLANTVTATLTDDRITPELIENSVFLLYARITSDPQILFTIPFTEPNLGLSLYYVLDASLNQIEVLGVSFAGFTPIPNPIDQVRFVIIPVNMDFSSLANLTYDEMVSQFGLD